MADGFEDHCWRDVIPPDDIAVYAAYARETFVGAPAALLAVDLYEQVYKGGARPVSEVAKTWPMSCGEHAYAAIEPAKQLFAAARAARLPIFYSTGETRALAKPDFVSATRRRRGASDPMDYAIRPEFAPQAGDVVIVKQRASAFFGTPLGAHLTQLGIATVIVCGETTSGCVRASAVDAYSLGYHVVLAEECCFDRSVIAHKVNLFDLHHKYADVMHLAELLAALTPPSARKAG